MCHSDARLDKARAGFDARWNRAQLFKMVARRRGALVKTEEFYNRRELANSAWGELGRC